MTQKTVAIVTWTRGCNYGTILQAYSLCSTLNLRGYDATLLNDGALTAELASVDTKASPMPTPVAPAPLSKKEYYLRKAKKALRVLFSPAARRIYKNERVFEAASQNKLAAFNAFKATYLKQSDPVSLENLAEFGSRYDVYVCGSDQIWSYRSDPASEYYYLGFTAPDKKRIAYAPCIGDLSFSDEQANLLGPLISRFSALSVRDDHGKALVERLTDRPVSLVCDPVLLKSADQWVKEFSLQKTKKPYLLCYILGTHPWYRKKILELSKKLRLPIKWIPVNPEQTEFLKGNTDPCGPREFLELFYNASFVCTDSYHGTLFSLLFEKQFVNLQRYENEENAENGRFYSLYRTLELSRKLLGKEDPVDSQKPLDYARIEKAVFALRESSLSYLFDALEEQP